MDKHSFTCRSEKFGNQSSVIIILYVDFSRTMSTQFSNTGWHSICCCCCCLFVFLNSAANSGFVSFSTVAQKGQSQISLPKHKSIFQNTNQFTKTQISLPKHKTISQNTNQFPKTQISLPKHKTISQNTNQFRRNTNQFTKTQINF